METKETVASYLTPIKAAKCTFYNALNKPLSSKNPVPDIDSLLVHCFPITVHILALRPLLNNNRID